MDALVLAPSAYEILVSDFPEARDDALASLATQISSADPRCPLCPALLAGALQPSPAALQAANSRGGGKSRDLRASSHALSK